MNCGFEKKNNWKAIIVLMYIFSIKLEADIIIIMNIIIPSQEQSHLIFEIMKGTSMCADGIHINCASLVQIMLPSSLWSVAEIFIQRTLLEQRSEVSINDYLSGLDKCCDPFQRRKKDRAVCLYFSSRYPDHLKQASLAVICYLKKYKMSVRQKQTN